MKRSPIALDAKVRTWQVDVAKNLVRIFEEIRRATGAPVEELFAQAGMTSSMFYRVKRGEYFPGLVICLRVLALADEIIGPNVFGMGDLLPPNGVPNGHGETDPTAA